MTRPSERAKLPYLHNLTILVQWILNWVAQSTMSKLSGNPVIRT